MIRNALKNVTLACLPLLVAATAHAADLGLAGCFVGSLSRNTDGSLVFATCQDSPNGTYFSQDFGDNWTFAGGGTYTAGEGSQVLANSTHAFLRTENRKIFRAALPAPSTVWAPVWEDVTPFSGTTSQGAVAVSGNRLYVAGAQGQVLLIDATTLTVTQTTTLSNANTLGYQVELVGNSIFVLAGVTPDLTTRKVFKAALDGSGTIGTWSEVTTLPSTVSPFSISAAPNGSLYVVGDDSLELGTPDSLYVSANEGTSFTEASSAGLTGACFGTNTYIIGNTVSINAGAAFSTLTTAQTTTGVRRLEGRGCVVDPTNDSRVLFSSDGGVLRTTTFTATAPAWVEASGGFQAATVTEIVQLPTSKNRVAVATNGGFAFTDTFTSPSITWGYTCPDNSLLCGGFTKYLAADQANSAKFYAWLQGATKIYLGTLGGSGSAATLTWSDFLTTPAGLEPTAIHSFDVLPTQVGIAFTGRGSQNELTGFLRLYNTADGAVSKEALNGKPVKEFFAVTSSTLIAAVGTFADPNPTAYVPGFYRSDDGGTTFNLIVDSDLPSAPGNIEFALDVANDILYLGYTGLNGDTRLLLLEKARNGGTDWTRAAAEGLPASISSLAVNPGTGSLYIGAFEKVLQSLDSGETLTLLQQGKTTETFTALFFDDLVAGSNAGLQSLDDPTCATSLAKKKGTLSAFPASRVAVVDYDGFATKGQIQFRSAKKKVPGRN